MTHLRQLAGRQDEVAADGTNPAPQRVVKTGPPPDARCSQAVLTVERVERTRDRRQFLPGDSALLVPGANADVYTPARFVGFLLRQPRPYRLGSWWRRCLM